MAPGSGGNISVGEASILNVSAVVNEKFKKTTLGSHVKGKNFRKNRVVFSGERFGINPGADGNILWAQGRGVSNGDVVCTIGFFDIYSIAEFTGAADGTALPGAALTITG